jgi:hypothetical protein
MYPVMYFDMFMICLFYVEYNTSAINTNASFVDVLSATGASCRTGLGKATEGTTV